MQNYRMRTILCVLMKNIIPLIGFLFFIFFELEKRELFSDERFSLDLTSTNKVKEGVHWLQEQSYFCQTMKKLSKEYDSNWDGHRRLVSEFC